jgi:hypothetical protein
MLLQTLSRDAVAIIAGVALCYLSLTVARQNETFNLGSVPFYLVVLAALLLLRFAHPDLATVPWGIRMHSPARWSWLSLAVSMGISIWLYWSSLSRFIEGPLSPPWSKFALLGGPVLAPLAVAALGG